MPSAFFSTLTLVDPEQPDGHGYDQDGDEAEDEGEQQLESLDSFFDVDEEQATSRESDGPCLVNGSHNSGSQEGKISDNSLHVPSSQSFQ
jgi:hypothetical protein